MNLQDKALKISQDTFLGGHPRLFETAGRMQLIILLKEGIYPSSKLLDIGCGCLRGGYWLIHFLNPGCYFGLEPNTAMLETGLKEFIDPSVLDRKQPRFDNNDTFDFSVFDETFDFFIARSIWSHTSKAQIKKMLDAFLLSSHEESAFLTSYLRAESRADEYRGEDWIGQSHESSTPGVVMHSLPWIRRSCRKRGLVVNEVTRKGDNFGRQVWLVIRHQQTSENYKKIFRERFTY